MTIPTEVFPTVKQTTEKAILAVLPKVSVTGSGVLFNSADVANVATNLDKLVADGVLASRAAEATPFKDKWRITVLEPLTAGAAGAGITLKPKTERGKVESVRFTDVDLLRFMGACLAQAKKLAPSKTGEQGEAIYPYDAIEAIGAEFKRTDGKTEMPWQHRTYCESFNEGATGHKPNGNVRAFIGQALKYANGNHERQARKDSVIVFPGVVAETADDGTGEPEGESGE